MGGRPNSWPAGTFDTCRLVGKMAVTSARHGHRKTRTVQYGKKKRLLYSSLEELLLWLLGLAGMNCVRYR